MSSIGNKYRKFDTLDYASLVHSPQDEYEYKDEEMNERQLSTMELIIAQPPFKHEVDWYLKNEEIPTPDLLHAMYWQMKDAGWKQRCIDFKLSQAVHYSKEAMLYRKLENARIQQELKQGEPCSQEKMFEKIEKYRSNVLEDDCQQAQNLEDHLFESHHKSALHRNPGRIDLEDSQH